MEACDLQVAVALSQQAQALAAKFLLLSEGSWRSGSASAA